MPDTPRSDWELGASLGQCLQQLKSTDPRAIRAVLHDLLGNERHLSQPLRHLIEQPGFAQLNPSDSLALRLSRRDALLQTLEEVYQPAILLRVREVLDGYLGFETSSESGRTEKRPHGLAPSSHQTNAGKIADTISEEAADEGTHHTTNHSGQQAKGSAPSKSSQLANEAFQKGLMATQSGHDRQAIDWFSECLAKEPNHAEAYLQRGKAWIGAKDHGSAMNDFDSAIRLLPCYSEAYAQRGLLHELSGAEDKARQDWQKAASLGHRHAAHWLQRSRTSSPKQASSSNQSGSSSHQKSKATTDPTTLYQYGIRSLQKKDYQKAEQWFTTCISAAPDRADAYLARGMARFAQRQDGAALSDFETALRLSPNDGEAYAQRGLLQAAMGADREAQKDWENALRLGHPHAGEWLTQQQKRCTDLHLRDGIKAAAAGQHEQAMHCFRKALEINTRHADSLFHGSLSLSKLNQQDEAIKWLDQYITIRPNEAEAYLRRGQERMSLDQHAKALLDFDSAIQLAPECAEAFTFRGLTQRSLGRTKEGISDLRKAARLGHHEAIEWLRFLENPAAQEEEIHHPQSKIVTAWRNIRSKKLIANITTVLIAFLIGYIAYQILEKGGINLIHVLAVGAGSVFAAWSQYKNRTDAKKRASEQNQYPNFLVIVLNDNDNSFEHVVNCFVRHIPLIQPQQARELAQKIHTEGSAVVHKAPREQAEHYYQVLKDEGLTMAPLKRDRATH